MSAPSGETVAMAAEAPSTSVRTTRQGRAVERVLADADTFLSAQDIYVALRDTGEGVGLATVYRHLQKLSDAGALDAVTGADGQLVYRQCGSGHHHHLVCRSCGRTVEIEAGQAEAWAAQVGAANGFDDVEHTIELIGTCAACRAEALS